MGRVDGRSTWKTSQHFGFGSQKPSLGYSNEPGTRSRGTYSVRHETHLWSLCLARCGILTLLGLAKLRSFTQSVKAPPQPIRSST
ncbi:uncharacterized protein PHALS_02411 [Plasmopara halstedii]|uniref:Uncharacterized protein n=1 Tax=Plasmopara halstedii TaxID=4781 RepID=A0A0P1AXW6_PLAHL|nr:uncharacterized protein PHALS_02411 [Plasmopara halstedii]CEG46088.1 hypothetical protein PHALS_02411 [Plasmopara halstedii]|eukprot:XP_024582457.1 hypothetical protein PHALS_02411 [Plasmopara halstedii]